MNLTLRLSDSALQGLRALAELSDVEYNILLRAVSSTEPRVGAKAFAAAVAAKAGRDDSKFSEVVFGLTALYMARSSRNVGVSEFLVHVDAALDEFPEFNEPRARGLITARLEPLIKQDDSLGVTAKAIDVLFEKERVFCSCRVMTDIRPIFSPEASDVPTAAEVVHTLRVHYHRGEALDEFFVSLDDSDLDEILEAVQRARTKSQSLSQLMNEGMKLKVLKV